MNTLTDCPTFIDLRAIAENPASRTAPGADPFGSDARILPVRAGDCEVGVIHLTSGQGEARASHGDIWIFAQSGSVTLETPAGALRLAPGQSCGIASGTDFAWNAAEPATLVFMRYKQGTPHAAGIVRIDNEAQLLPSNPPAADVLLGETPKCRTNSMFISADETFKCGVWDSTPYQRSAIFFHHTELMHLLEGSVTFVDATGRVATFAAGDTFIIEQGAECTWDSQVQVAKIYAHWRPAA